MSVSGSPSAGLGPDAVLNRLDWQLGEVGRRQHRFAWLRDPSSGDWLAVDAYYPGNRVVVVANPDPPLLRVCEDLVPRNGLFLITVSGAELTGGSQDLAKTLRARLEIQGWEPRSDVPRDAAMPAPRRPPVVPPPVVPPPVVPPPDVQVRRRSANELPEFTDSPRPLRNQAPEPEPEPDDFDVPADVRVHARRPASAAVPRSRTAARRRPRGRGSESEGIGVGVTLVVVAALELGLGGGLVGLGAGQIVLGFGFVLDCCARIIGMVAASQSGDLDAAWTAVLFGSPALWGLSDSPDQGDAVPVARATAVIAGFVVALGVFFWIV